MIDSWPLGISERPVSVPECLFGDFSKDIWFSAERQSEGDGYFFWLGKLSLSNGMSRFMSMESEDGTLRNTPSELSKPHGNSNPHGLVFDFANSGITVFKQDCDHYVQFDIAKRKWSVSSAKSVSPDAAVLWSTFFEDPANRNGMIVCYATGKFADSEIVFGFLPKSGTGGFEEIMRIPERMQAHMVRPIGDRWILASQFSRPVFEFPEGGAISGAQRFRNAMIEFSYRDFVEETSAKDDVSLHMRKEGGRLSAIGEFAAYLNRKIRDSASSSEAEYWEKCGHPYRLLPWEFFVLDRLDRSVKSVRTPAPMAAHFEMRETASGKIELFVSSHNFVAYPKYHYYWPAKIAKYSFDPANGEACFEGESSDEFGFRFTNHKVARIAGIWPCVITIGEPNRVMAFRCDTLEKVLEFDIGRNLIGNYGTSELLRKKLNGEGLGIESYLAFSLSDSWKYMLILGNRTATVWELPGWTPIHSFEYLPQAPMRGSEWKISSVHLHENMGFPFE